jgi:hypothetical protein
MDGLTRPSGAGSTIEIDGETLILDAIGLKDWGVVEAHLLRLKRSSVLVAAHDASKDLPDDVGKRLRREAMDRVMQIQNVDGDEVVGWVTGTIDGIVFVLWHKLEGRYPGKFTLESLSQKMAAMTDAEQDAARAAMNQAGTVGAENFTTSPPQEAAGVA